MTEMKGNKVVENQLLFYKIIFLCCLIVLAVFTILVFCNFPRIANNLNLVIAIVIFLSIYLYFIFAFLGEKINETYLDLLDYSDIKDIRDLLNDDDFVNKIKKTEKTKNYISELWCQINRRAEKAKIAPLKHLDSRITDLKDFIKDYYTRNK